MSILKLTQSFIDNDLRVSNGKARQGFADTEVVPGFYIETRATSPGTGTAYLRYRDQSGALRHQRLQRFESGDGTLLADLRMKAKQLRAEILLGRQPDAEKRAKKEIPTLDDYFRNFYLPTKKLHLKSWQSQESLYRRYLKDKWGAKRLDQISRKEIQMHHNALRTSGLAPATANHMIKLLKTLLGTATLLGTIEVNNATRIPLFTENNKIEHYLDAAHLEKLLEVLRTDSNRRVCLVAMFLLSTGARLNEALNATWSQIDMQNRVWRIPASVSKSKRDRAVPLNDSAVEVLSQLQLSAEGKHTFLFAGPSGERLTVIHKVWGRLRKKAGLPHLRLHDLRHQFASFLVNSGRTLYEVQQILGHSDPKVTMRYSHLSSKSLQAAANSASVIIKAASAVPANAESTS